MTRSPAKERVVAAMLLAALGGAGTARAQTQMQPSQPSATIDGLPSQARVSLQTDQLPYEVGKGPKLGPYYLIRSEDSLSSLFPPGHKPDLFDPLKDIHITPDGSVYLTLSYDQRVRYEYYGVTGFDLHKPSHQSVIGLRESPGADLHLGEHFRVYTGVQSGEVGGRNFGTPAPPNRDDLSLLQAFGEVYGTVQGTTLGLRAGRQEMVLGNGTLFAARDNTNINQTYDGVRAYADTPDFRVDGFFLENVVNVSGVFQDYSTPHQQYWGLYGSWKVPGTRGIFMDPFYVGYYNRRATMDNLVGSEARSILGDRLWGTLGRFDFDWTAIGQTGSQARHDVAAYEVVTDTGLNFLNVPTHPRLGLHLDIASGGRSDTGTVRTFEPLNFSSIYYTEAPLLAPMNLMDMGLGLSATILPKVRIQGIVSGFWRYSTNDYVYNFVNLPYARTNLSRSTYVGIQPEMRLGWAINRHLTMVGQLAWFNAGAALAEAGGKNQEYYASYLLFRF